MNALLRAGDTVTHKPSGNRYVIACDQVGQYAAVICGWPDGDVRAIECKVEIAASDAEREQMLRQAADSRDDHGGLSRRAVIAREQLHASKLCDEWCIHCRTEREAAMKAAERAVIEAAVKLRIEYTKWNKMPGMTDSEIVEWERQQSVVGGCNREFQVSTDALLNLRAEQAREAKP